MNALLTPRQSQVARLIARGRSNKEIAGDLGIAFQTTKFHVHELITRLGARNRAHAAALAAGVVDLDSQAASYASGGPVV